MFFVLVGKMFFFLSLGVKKKEKNRENVFLNKQNIKERKEAEMVKEKKMK